MSSQNQPQVLTEVPVFICYRRVDGAEVAEWLYRALDGLVYSTDDGPRRIRCYFDTATPGVSDWQEFLARKLKGSFYLLFVSTPAAAVDLASEEGVDQVMEELDEWTVTLERTPIVIDTTDEGARWAPPPLRSQWERLNRIRLYPQAIDRDPSHTESVRQRLLETFRELESPTVDERVRREEKLRRGAETATRQAKHRLRVALVALGLAVVLSIAVAGMRHSAVKRARLATSDRLANEAESSERADLSLLLAAQALELEETPVSRHSLLSGLLVAPRLRQLLESAAQTPGALPARIWAVAWSGDGQRLAASGDDGSLTLWEVGSWRSPRRIPVDRPGKPAIWALALDKDGRLAAGDNHGWIGLWRDDGSEWEQIGHMGVLGPRPDDCEAGGFSGERQDHEVKVFRLAFSPDGDWLAAGSRAGVSVWNFAHESGRRLDARETWGLAFEPKSDADNKKVRLATAGQEKLIEQQDMEGKGRARPFWCDRNREWSAAAPHPGAVAMWDIETKDKVTKLWESKSGHPRVATSVAFHPTDGETLASADESGVIHLWDRDSGVMKQWDLEKGETTVDFSRRSPRARRHDSVWSLAFDPNGRVLASGGENDGRVVLWDLETGRPLGDDAIGAPGSIWTLAFASDSPRLAASVAGEIRRVAILDPGPGSTLRPALSASLAISPDGGMIASGVAPSARLETDDKRIAPMELLRAEPSIWRAWRETSELTVPDQPIRLGSLELDTVEVIVAKPDSRDDEDPTPRWFRAVALGPNGLRAAVADSSGTVRVRRQDDEVEPIVTGHTHPVDALAIDATGTRLAAGGRDRQIRIWSLAGSKTARPQGSLTLRAGHWVRSLAFHPDGRVLAVGDRFGNVSRWALDSGQQVGETLKGPRFENPCLAVAFDRDGERLAAGYEDGVVVVWDLRSARAVGTFPTADVAGFKNSPDTKQNTGRAPSAEAVLALAFHPEEEILATASATETITLWSLDAASWQQEACDRIGRTLTPRERDHYLHDRHYPLACRSGDS